MPLLMQREKHLLQSNPFTFTKRPEGPAFQAPGRYSQVPFPSYTGRVLTVRSLAKTYRRGFPLLRRTVTAVLHDVSFDVDDGEVVGLLGPNGAGKTTILHAIAGLLYVDGGEMRIDGEPLTPVRASRLVALCSSADRSFYYRLTLRENLRFFGRLQGLHGGRLTQRIDAALEVTNLASFAGRRYSRCSSGVRQRLTFARALLSDAPIVLLDEPTRAVDPLHAQMMRRFVRETLCGELRKAVVLATNVLEEAWTTCDRIVLLSAGRPVAIDTPAALGKRFTTHAYDLPAPDELFRSEQAI
jgi:ABC-2 type transport system ATP-binding protein